MSNATSPVRYECFATPIWRIPGDGRIDLDALASAIQAERQGDPQGTKVSNMGGWQSQNVLFRKEPFQPVADYIREIAEKVFRDWGFDFLGHPPVMNSLWANINRGPDVNHLHHHWGFALHNFNLLSGAFYVKCNPGSGPIQLIDERPSSKFITQISLPFVPNPSKYIGASFVVKPNPGQLVMFPAWLEHKVEPNEDDQERISMSYNFSVPQALLDQMHEQRDHSDP